jgi:biotin synthase
MFENLGLNVARQTDNGSNPRPDNRSGWLDGETPNVIAEHVAASDPASLEVRLWDPSTQLHYRGKRRGRRARAAHQRVTEHQP